VRGMIFLTGGTGFLGSQIARLLQRAREEPILALVRGEKEEAERRLARAWSDWPELAASIGGRVRVIPGDLTQPRLGMDAGSYDELTKGLTVVIHAAAELELDGPLETLRRINVQGVASLLALASAAHADHGLERFAHVSTAYVAGGRKGEVAEADLTDAYGFSNAYEQTKYEGESLVRRSGLPLSVFRPGMIVGDSRTGEIRAFNTVYVPLRLYLTGRLKLIPARPDMPLNVVPVDYVASAVAKLAFDPRAAGLTFHLTVPAAHLPGARELLEAAGSWAADELGYAPPRARFVPVSGLERLAQLGRLGVPAVLLSYFAEERTYRCDNAERLLGRYEPDWKSILPRLLHYAADRGFLRRSGRTAHEQVLTRLESKRLPLRLHDIGMDGKTTHRSGAEMSEEIQEAAAALGSLGVRPADRVSLLGLNSSRYLSLDVAIGLCGAVSVPLYYTSPHQEIKEMVEASGARILLIGAPGVLAVAPLLPQSVVVASFCETPVPQSLSQRVLSWESFLSLGKAAGRAASALQAPVGFEDLATLRFTSGTTGAPKEVSFRHRQISWMAETLVSLLPWKARLAPARYLSFLPMNHVVEGILGTYAPSFMPAPVDVYFLHDFRALSRALPRVRPTVFFSVPRFYEKVWESFAGGMAGRLYSMVPGGALHAALRPILRRVLLHKAGLGSCAQLIAGSAPCSERLLESFRELGIEIHNAYGLTEAPLVTLNRFGANHLGTVGVPLPDTDVRLARDGEILVRGPQVAFDQGDGWLHTGDLGDISAEGDLVINGRKKEILITSYGKNIHPARIEGMLRQIPGVSEAMVLGDERPFLTAMLWLKAGSASGESLREIDEAVRTMNRNLSHPEQVKRWLVLSESPSIDNGELTGNLKLRRQRVLSRRADAVSMLYSGEADVAAPELDVLHLGESQCA
jgi:long-chain acyl-CoA synthetase